MDLANWRQSLPLAVAVGALVWVVGYMNTDNKELEEDEELVSEEDSEDEEEMDDLDDDYGPSQLSAKQLRKRKEALPPPPSAFEWYINRNFYTAVPYPKGWTAQDEENTFAISKRKKGQMAKPGDTVLTVSCMPHQPPEFARTFLHNFPLQLRQANKKVLGSWEVRKLNETFEQHVMDFEDPGGQGGIPPIMVRNYLVVNKSTGAVYLVMFESSKASWEEMWETVGDPMINGMDFYKHF